MITSEFLADLGLPVVDTDAISKAQVGQWITLILIILKYYLIKYNNSKMIKNEKQNC